MKPLLAPALKFSHQQQLGAKASSSTSSSMSDSPTSAGSSATPTVKDAPKETKESGNSATSAQQHAAAVAAYAATTACWASVRPSLLSDFVKTAIDVAKDDQWQIRLVRFDSFRLCFVAACLVLAFLNLQKKLLAFFFSCRFLVVLLSRHLFLVQPKDVDAIWVLADRLLTDAQAEVREAASNLIGSLVAISALPSTLVRESESFTPTEDRQLHEKLAPFMKVYDGVCAALVKKYRALSNTSNAKKATKDAQGVYYSLSMFLQPAHSLTRARTLALPI